MLRLVRDSDTPGEAHCDRVILRVILRHCVPDVSVMTITNELQDSSDARSPDSLHPVKVDVGCAARVDLG